MKIFLAVVTAALLCAVSATAATPAAYRAQMNGICHTMVPQLTKAQKAQAATAQSGGHAKNSVALRKQITLQLSLDRQLEQVAVPAALKLQMAPLLTVLKQIDPYLHRAFALATPTSSGLAALKQLAAAVKLETKMFKLFGTTGLTSCAP